MPFAIVHLIVIALALPMLVRRLRARVPTRPDAITLALGLFGVVAVASTIVEWGGFFAFFYSSAEYARDLHRHLTGYALEQPGKGIANAVPALTTFGDGLLAYVLVREGLSTTAARRLLIGLATIAVVVAALGVAQALTGIGLQFTWQRFDPGIIRINSTYSDPNALAAFLAMLLPILAGLAASTRSTAVRVTWLAAAVLVVLAVVLTGGRAGVLAAGLGLATGIGLGLWRGLERNDPWPMARRHARRVYIGTLAVAIGLAMTLTIVGTLRDSRHHDQNSYLDTALYTLNLRQPIDEKLKGRLTIWRMVGQMIRDAPTFGVGVGQIYGTFAVYNREAQAFGPDVRLSAHNTFLNIAAETGVTGLVIWLLIMTLLFRAAFRPGDAHEPTDVGWLRAGIAGGILAFSVTMITGDRVVLREDLVMLASVAALASAWVQSDRLAGMCRPGLVLLMSTAVFLTVPVRIGVAERDLPLDRISFGLHGQEFSPTGEPFHWTTDRVTFHVPATARMLIIPVKTLSPTEQRVRVRLNERAVDEIVLQTHAWRTLRYPLPPPRDDRRYHRVELLVSPTWQPANDGRTLGVMLGDYRWEP